MLRVGIDVGGTNTDAVLMDGNRPVKWVKMNNSADITAGIVAGLNQLLAQTHVAADQIGAVMIGTTQFTHAVVQRRGPPPGAAAPAGAPAPPPPAPARS